MKHPAHGSRPTGKEHSDTTGERPAGESKRRLHWDILHALALLGIFLAYLYHFETLDQHVFIIILVLTTGVGIATAVVWRFTAIYTVEAFKSVFHLLKGRSDSLCLVRSPQAETHSVLDHLYMAVEWCFFPTLVVFFVLSYIADAVTPSGEAVVRTEGGSWWLIYIFMFLIPPLATFISIPIRLIMDSSLMRYDTQGRVLEPFGLIFKRMFRAVGGVGALASFANVAINKAGVANAFMDAFTILLYVFPTIFIATIFYGYWHPGYLRRIEEKIEMLGYQMYSFEGTRDGPPTLMPVIDERENTELTLSYRIDARGRKLPLPEAAAPDWGTDSPGQTPEEATPQPSLKEGIEEKAREGEGYGKEDKGGKSEEDYDVEKEGEEGEKEYNKEEGKEDDYDKEEGKEEDYDKE
ncbi:MAG: hypothetical protein KAU14_01785, partial [Thermoplasmata archaeon]|nr:hypothetical protein [Thermoplasmata archaeon]